MSIASEIERLKAAKSCIKSAIESKGVSVPSNLKLQGYSDCINCIKTTDYSCGTFAYGLCSSSVTLPLCRGRGIGTVHGEYMDNGGVVALFSGQSYNSSCDANRLGLMKKMPGCNTQWNTAYKSISDSRHGLSYYVWQHKTNKDCFLINTTYCYYDTGSGSNWTSTCYYFRTGVDFSVPCMTCLGESCRYTCVVGGNVCVNEDCCNPGSNYTYIGSIDQICKCRGTPKSPILCTVNTCSSNNNYSYAAVFC